MGSSFPLLILAVLLVALAQSWWFSEAAKRRRELRAARRVPIAEVREGEVARVAGRVRAVGELFRAPLSGRPCVFFEVTVEEYQSGGRSGRWVRIVRETDGMDFLVEDGTGKAVVRYDGMEALTHGDHERDSGLFNDATPEIEAFLARHGKKSTGWIFNRRLRYRERIFEPGKTVTVLGEAHWEQDPDPETAGTGYRDVPKRLVLRARPEGPVLASDEPGLA